MTGLIEKAIVDVEGTEWQPVAVALVVVALVLLPVLSILLYVRRQHFPINSTPIFLTILSQVGASLYIVNLLHPMMVSTSAIPCGLHYLLSFFDIFPFFTCSMLQMYRIWFVAGVQARMSKRRQDFLTKNARLVTPHMLSLTLAGVSCILLIQLIVQLSTHAKYLGVPISYQEEVQVTTSNPDGTTTEKMVMVKPCLLQNSGESTLVRFFWWVLICLNLMFNYLMRNIRDAFNLREIWRKVVYWFALGTPLNMMATLAIGLSGKARQNAFAMGQVAYAVAAFSYLWYACIIPIKQTYADELRPLMSATSSAKTSMREESVDFLAVKTTGELKEALENPVTMAQFKDYLVAEFCVENALFLSILKQFDEGRDLGNDALAHSCLDTLIHEYIREGVAHEINIDHKLRREVIRAYENFVKTQNMSSELLSSLQKAEEEILRVCLDPFKRFARKGVFSKSRSSTFGSLQMSAVLNANKVVASDQRKAI